MRANVGMIVVGLLIASAGIAQTYVVGQDQAKYFGSLFTNVKLPDAWKIFAIEAKKDHLVIKCRSPKQGLAEVGFYNLSTGQNFQEKTEKFGISVVSGKADPVLVKELAKIARAGEAGFKWQQASPSKAPSNDKKQIKRLLKARELYAFGKKKQAVGIVEDVESQARGAGVIAQAGRYFVDFGFQKKGRQAFDKAQALIRKNMAEKPSDSYVMAEAVSVYALMGEVKKAENLYWKLMELHKEPIEGKRCLAGKVGSAMVEAKKDDLALAFYHRVMKASPNCKWVYLNAMYIEAKSERFEQIDKLAHQALKLWPKDQDILFTWGNVYHVSGKFKRSSKMFLSLAAINPRYPTLLSLLGSSLLNLGKTDARLKDVKRQVKLHPNNLGWYYGLGAIYFYRKEYKKALPYLERTAKLAPGEARPKIYLALALYWLGHRDEARKLLDSIKYLAYEDPDVYFCQAIVWSDKDKKRSLAAMQTFVNILDNEPSRVQWGNKRARAHKILDELKKGNIEAILQEGKPEHAGKKTKLSFWMIAFGVLLIFIGWGYLLFRPKKSKKNE